MTPASLKNSETSFTQTSETQKNYFSNLLDIIGRIYGISHENSFRSQSERLQSATTPIWNIRPKIGTFVGREEEKRELELHCFPSRKGEPRKVVLVLVHGSGGMGKSQLTAEFLHERKELFSFGWWINAETEDTFNQGLVKLADELFFFDPRGKKTDEITQQLKGHLSTEKAHGWVIILDNLEIDFTTEALKRLPDSGGVVLVTSRNSLREALSHERDRGFHSLHVMELNEPDCCLLLEKKSQTDQTKEFQEIVQRLGRLPLAIDLAGAYMFKDNMSAQNLLESLKSGNDDFSNDQQLRPVALTFKLSIQQLQKSHPASLSLLQRISFLAPDNIPLSTVSATLVENDYTERKSITQLVDFSIISCNEAKNRLNIHRLMQKVAQKHCNEREFPGHCINPKECVQQLTKNLSLLMKEKNRTLDDVNRRKELLPHAEALYMHIQELQLQRERETAKFLQAWGVICFDTGNATKQLELLEVVQPLFESLNDEKMLMSCLENKGDAHELLFQQEAVDNYRDALAMAKEIYGTEDQRGQRVPPGRP